MTRFIDDKNTLERLVRLETLVDERFTAQQKALDIAVVSQGKIVENAKEVISEKLEGLNQHKERLIRMETSFATKDGMGLVEIALQNKINAIKDAIDVKFGALEKANDVKIALMNKIGIAAIIVFAVIEFYFRFIKK